MTTQETIRLRERIRTLFDRGADGGSGTTKLIRSQPGWMVEWRHAGETIMLKSRADLDRIAYLLGVTCKCGVGITDLPIFFRAGQLSTNVDTEGRIERLTGSDHMFHRCKDCGESFCTCGVQHPAKVQADV